jgi:hypothetical protein
MGKNYNSTNLMRLKAISAVLFLLCAAGGAFSQLTQVEEARLRMLTAILASPTPI